MSKNDATVPVLVAELDRRTPTVVYRPAENPGQDEEAAA